MNVSDKIFIAGHSGLVGSAITSKLRSKGYSNLVLKTHSELDLTNQLHVKNFFQSEKIEYVIVAAAKVGGIYANDLYRADFIYENLMIEANLIHQSYLNEVKKLLFLGSTCIYPKNSPQPIQEDSLLTSPLEYTNEPYAIAKISGIKMCESYNLQYGTNFISAMPTNLYGPNDNFDLEKSHVLPALIRKIHLAFLLSNNKLEEVSRDIEIADSLELKLYLKNFGISKDSVEIWGTGKPRREFLYSDDMAEACVFLLENVDFKDMYKDGQEGIRNTHVNIGTGTDVTIHELAKIISHVIGYNGELVFNTNKPDGPSQKLSDNSKINSLGWKHSIELKKGIKLAYDWYLNKH
jgi:GDP-L-fucose synthase